MLDTLTRKERNKRYYEKKKQSELNNTDYFKGTGIFAKSHSEAPTLAQEFFDSLKHDPGLLDHVSECFNVLTSQYFKAWEDRQRKQGLPLA